MSEFSLVKLPEKTLVKLIDAIQKGVGALYKPTGIVREAKAEAKRIKIIEAAKAKAQADGELTKLKMYDKIQERFLYTETKKQYNIDKVIATASQQLKQEPTVTDEPVNEDWATRFFNIIGDVSDEELQLLWGKILAGEVKKPKSFSLRTLEVLRNLSKEEAEIFIKVADFVINDSNHNLSFIFRGQFNDLSKFNVNYSDVLKLVECGLIQPGEDVSLHILREHYGKDLTYVSGKFAIIIEISKPKHEFDLRHEVPIILLTRAGTELLRLITTEPPLNYLKAFADGFKPLNKTYQTKASYSTLLSWAEDGTLTYDPPLTPL